MSQFEFFIVVRNHIFHTSKSHHKLRCNYMKDVLGVFKIFIGAMASILIVCGIHWMAILAGVMLGIIYFVIPKRYIN